MNLRFLRLAFEKTETTCKTNACRNGCKKKKIIINLSKHKINDYPCRSGGFVLVGDSVFKL